MLGGRISDASSASHNYLGIIHSFYVYESETFFSNTEVMDYLFPTGEDLTSDCTTPCAYYEGYFPNLSPLADSDIDSRYGTAYAMETTYDV